MALLNEKTWRTVLKDEFEHEYFKNIEDFIKSEKAVGKVIFPDEKLIFNAFEMTPFHEVRVIIIGQDPYHAPNQAMGLSFSVPKNVRTPASLKNIFKELYRDLSIPMPHHGDLSKWAQQGVFLLNAFLTVEEKLPLSHQNIGWQKFTDKVIQVLSDQMEGLVFMLWGNFARSKKKLIDSNKHLILESVHPSPLAGNGFIGNSHFSKCNEYLILKEKTPIQWNIE